MRSLIAWIGLAVVCAALAVGLFGQKVQGQPDLPAPPPPPAQDPLPPPAPTFPAPKGVSPTDKPGSIQFTPTGPDVAPIAPPTDSPPDNKMTPVGGAQQVKAMENGPLPQIGTPPPPPFPSVTTPNFELPPPVITPAGPDAAPGLSPPAKFQSPHTLPTEPPSGSAVAGPVRPGKNEPTVSVEWIGPGSAKLNQPMTCQILVRNTGPVAVDQVVVRHRLPEGVQQHGSEPVANVEGRVLSWNLGTMTSGQTKRIDVQLVSQVKGALNCHADVTFTASSTLQLQVREPLLAVKVKCAEKVILGEQVTFQITLCNPGDGVTENITIRTMLPDGLEHSQGRVLDVNTGQLAPNETKTLQLVCQARSPGLQPTSFQASAAGGLKAVDTANLEILQPKLDLVMVGPKLRYIDRHAVYTLKVANPSSAPADNVTLSEVVPVGFKFQNASGSGRYDEVTRTVTWFLGDLMPGQNREMNVELKATAAGDHKLLAQVNSARGVKTEAEAVTHVEGLSSLQVDVVDSEDPVEVGAETVYQIRIANTGTKTETNLQLICTLAEPMEFRGAKNEADLRCRPEGRDVIFEPLAKLTPKAEIIYRVTVKGKQPGNFRFRVQVRAESLSEPIIREEMTRVYSDDAPLR